MATVPTGYVFYDVSAGKSYAAGKTFPTLGEFGEKELKKARAIKK